MVAECQRLTLQELQHRLFCNLPPLSWFYLSAWMAFTGSCLFNKEKKEETRFQIITKVKYVLPNFFWASVFNLEQISWCSSLASHAFIVHLLRNVLSSSKVPIWWSHKLILFSKLLICFVILIWGCNKPPFDFKSQRRYGKCVVLNLFFQMCWKQADALKQFIVIKACLPIKHKTINS